MPICQQNWVLWWFSRIWAWLNLLLCQLWSFCDLSHANVPFCLDWLSGRGENHKKGTEGGGCFRMMFSHLMFWFVLFFLFKSNFDTPTLFPVSPKQLETGGFERAGAGDCGSLETGIVLSCWVWQQKCQGWYALEGGGRRGIELGVGEGLTGC